MGSDLLLLVFVHELCSWQVLLTGNERKAVQMFMNNVIMQLCNHVPLLTTAYLCNAL